MKRLTAIYKGRVIVKRDALDRYESSLRSTGLSQADALATCAATILQECREWRSEGAIA